MLIVLFPPTLNQNYKGKVSIVPSFFNELNIPNEVLKMHNGDEVETIKDVTMSIIKENKYPSLNSFSIVEHELKYPDPSRVASFHFQIPAYTIMQDSLELDESPVSFYGAIRWISVDDAILNDLLEDV